MKKFLLILVVLLVLGGVVYAERHQLKSLMMGSKPVAMVSPTAAMSPTQAVNTVYMSKTDSVKGMYMTDPKGLTLYIFDKDAKGVSNCYGACATAWPPYVVAAGVTPGALPADVTLVTRTGGAMQYTYKGMPLYYFASDTKLGDIRGDGVGGVWHIVKL